MRTEKEMYDLILDIAKNDERIRQYILMAPEQIQMYRKTFFKTMMWFM